MEAAEAKKLLLLVTTVSCGGTPARYTSTDGVSWTAIAGSARTMSNLSGTVQVGLAVTSHSAGVLSPSYFDQINETPGTSPALPPPAAVTVTPPVVPSGITSYPIATAYNDASQPTSLTYSDNEVASYGYDSASGWLSSLATTPAGGSATTLLGSIGYSGAGGAAGHATSASVGGAGAGTYSFSASYDADTRLSSLSLSTVSSGTILFRSQRGYDASGNVTAVNTTLSAGTDNQVFCYDDENRLVWAGSTGTPSCGSSLTAGSLSSAAYTQTFAYDNLDRLTSGPLGSYTYGDSAHLHGVTSIGSGPTYTAKYDAVGDMTCRAPDNTTTCAGTQTGAQLGYDNEGRLSGWQNAPSSPTTTDSFLYDGAGNRVEQSVTINGSITTTTTYVAGGLEEISANGTSTTLTKYFTGASGLPTAERVGTNGPLSYLATDGQGTVSAALDSAGNVTSSQLYTPYGTARYSNGSSPTSIGYTGQRADSATGLDYYQARYYDPTAGQFASADSANDGTNRYGYVGGNPTTATDPSGHYQCFDDACTRGGGSSRGGGGGRSGSSGGGGGPGGSVTHDCKTDLDDASDTCANYRDWETRMKQKRWDKLSGLRSGAGIALLVAGAADIAADIYVISHPGGLLTKVLALIDAGLVIAFGLLPAYYLLTDDETAYSPNTDVQNIIAGGTYAGGGVLLGTLVGVARAAKAMVDRLRGVLGLLKQLGPFGEAVASAAVDVAQGLLGGPGMAVLNALLALAGQALEAGLEAGVHALYAAAWIPKGNFDHQLNMDIGEWCAQNSGCTKPPSRYHTV